MFYLRNYYKILNKSVIIIFEFQSWKIPKYLQKQNLVSIKYFWPTILPDLIRKHGKNSTTNVTT